MSLLKANFIPSNFMSNGMWHSEWSASNHFVENILIQVVERQNFACKRERSILEARNGNNIGKSHHRTAMGSLRC